MSITVEIDEALLRAAEAATNIHNPDELVCAGLATLGKIPRSKSESGEWKRSSVPTAGKTTLAELLACADSLPDLSDAEVAAWERELAHPVPVRGPWKS